KGVQERPMEAEVAGGDEVAQVLEHRADLRAGGGVVEPRERRVVRVAGTVADGWAGRMPERWIGRRAQCEQALQHVRAHRLVGPGERRHRRHPMESYTAVARG